MAIKLIMGRRGEGKTSYLLGWLWEHREDEVAMFVPKEMQKKRIMRETNEELDVRSGGWGYTFKGDGKIDYAAIDDLWKFDHPKRLIKEVGSITREEIRCTMGNKIFDITTLEEIR